MSVDLTNHAGEPFGFSNTAWFRILTLAQAHGWSPHDDDTGEDGPEQFSTEQAGALADALDRAIGPRNDADAARWVSHELTRLLVTPSSSPLFSDEPISFEARAVRHWREFIAFARRGGFSVS